MPLGALRSQQKFRFFCCWVSKRRHHRLWSGKKLRRITYLISGVAYASSLRFLPRKLEAYATNKDAALRKCQRWVSTSRHHRLWSGKKLRRTTYLISGVVYAPSLRFLPRKLEAYATNDRSQVSNTKPSAFRPLYRLVRLLLALPCRTLNRGLLLQIT